MFAASGPEVVSHPLFIDNRLGSSSLALHAPHMCVSQAKECIVARTLMN